MRRISTRKQLVYLGALILAIIASGTHLIINMQRQAAIDAYKNATSNLAGGMAKQTNHFFIQADRALQAVKFQVVGSAQTPAQIAYWMQSQALSGILADQVARVTGVDSLILISPDGRVVNSSQAWPPNPVDVSGEFYFRHFQAVDDPGLVVGRPAQDPGTGVWKFPMARRIDGPNGVFAGVAVAEISLADLDAFYQLAMPPSRVLYLARSDGVVLLRYPARTSDFGLNIPSGSPWYSVVAKGGGVYDAPAYFTPEPVIAVVKPLLRLPFVVEASVPQSVALAQWQRERVWDILGGIFSAICAIGLLCLFGFQYFRIEASERILAAKNAELDVAHEQLAATLANLSQGVCFFDEDNKLLVFNQRFCQIIGLPPAAVRVGMSAAEIAELRIEAGTFWNITVEKYLANIDANKRAGLPVDETSILTDGRTISKHFEPLPGRGWVMTLEDISERCAAEQKIAYLAHHDVLTGLANRVSFRDQLNEAFTHAKPDKSFAMLCLDLDRFKEVNDSFGHAVGDGLLLAVADRLRATVRGGDTVARMGGDEFVILQLNITDKAETIGLARRIVEQIGKPFVIEGHRLSIGVSIGIAMAPSERMNPERLLKDADTALYRSKQAGRGTWRMFDAATTENLGADELDSVRQDSD